MVCSTDWRKLSLLPSQPFRAVMRLARLISRPKPRRSCCVTLSVALVPICGLSVLNVLFVTLRLVLPVSDQLVPVVSVSEKLKLALMRSDVRTSAPDSCVVPCDEERLNVWGSWNWICGIELGGGRS